MAGPGLPWRATHDPPHRSPHRAVREEILTYIVDRDYPPQCDEGRGEQADPAQILGMSRSAMSLRDTGRVAWRIEELKRVAWYVNCSMADLLETLKKARRVRSW